MRGIHEGAHWGLGYAAAVLTGCFAFALMALGSSVVFGGGLSAVYPMSERVGQFVVMLFFVSVVASFFTIFAAWLPVLLLYKVAKHFAIRSALYYIVLGALIGFVSASWIAFYLPGGTEVPFWSQTLALAWFSAPSGAIGGFIFWVTTGRFVNREEFTT